MGKQKRKQQVKSNGLVPPIKKLIKGGNIIEDKEKVIGAIYSQQVIDEVIRRVNAYDKLISILKHIEDISKTEEVTIDRLLKIKELVKKTLQEI